MQALLDAWSPQKTRPAHVELMSKFAHVPEELSGQLGLTQNKPRTTVDSLIDICVSSPRFIVLLEVSYEMEPTIPIIREWIVPVSGLVNDNDI